MLVASSLSHVLPSSGFNHAGFVSVVEFCEELFEVSNFFFVVRSRNLYRLTRRNEFLFKPFEPVFSDEFRREDFVTSTHKDIVARALRTNDVHVKQHSVMSSRDCVAGVGLFPKHEFAAGVTAHRTAFIGILSPDVFAA